MCAICVVLSMSDYTICTHAMGTNYSLTIFAGQHLFIISRKKTSK